MQIKSMLASLPTQAKKNCDTFQVREAGSAVAACCHVPLMLTLTLTLTLLVAAHACRHQQSFEWWKRWRHRPWRLQHPWCQPLVKPPLPVATQRVQVAPSNSS